MLIESKIKRDGGSKIDIGGVVYHFAPNAAGAHVCEVEDEDAIARFLSIREGFAPAPDIAPPPAPLRVAVVDMLDSMDDATLRAYAKERGIKVQGIALTKGENLRAKIRAVMHAQG
jgi:hypothetical protein